MGICIFKEIYHFVDTSNLWDGRDFFKSLVIFIMYIVINPVSLLIWFFSISFVNFARILSFYFLSLLKSQLYASLNFSISLISALNLLFFIAFFALLFLIFWDWSSCYWSELLSILAIVLYIFFLTLTLTLFNTMAKHFFNHMPKILIYFVVIFIVAHIFKFILIWRIIALQCCVGFCHTTVWISHPYTYVFLIIFETFFWGQWIV